MALIRCPECNKEISNKSRACIHCGYPIENIGSQGELSITTSTIQEDNSIEQLKNSDDEQIKYSVYDKNKKVFIIVAVILMIGILWLVKACQGNSNAQQRDLSNVFDFAFTMTMDDIIEYEYEMYGNTDYNFDEENNRLDFERYSSGKWKHKYFFDEETNLLTSVHYSGIVITFGDKDEAKCEHVTHLKNALLDEIGEWDEKPTGDSVRSVAYGRIDGVDCKILYFDGATQELSVRMVGDSRTVQQSENNTYSDSDDKNNSSNLDKTEDDGKLTDSEIEELAVKTLYSQLVGYENRYHNIDAESCRYSINKVERDDGNVEVYGIVYFYDEHGSVVKFGYDYQRNFTVHMTEWGSVPWCEME